MERKPIVPEIPERKTPGDSKETPIKVPDAKPGRDNPRNPKEDVV